MSWAKAKEEELTLFIAVSLIHTTPQAEEI